VTSLSATGSFAYRKNEDAIWHGVAPEKYLRLLPYVTGQRVLEIGAAEGVLSLLMADSDPQRQVTGLERNAGRHDEARRLQTRWRALGKHVDGCTMVQGDIRSRLDLLEHVDTFVAIRTIYHLQDAIPEIFAAVGAQVPNVVLCGNPNRALWPRSSPSTAKLGRWNRYASVEGMTEVLVSAGYTIGTVVREGDPIVTGHR
jgi:SAM-dependent methyltransferase